MYFCLILTCQLDKYENSNIITYMRNALHKFSLAAGLSMAVLGARCETEVPSKATIEIQNAKAAQIHRCMNLKEMPTFAEKKFEITQYMARVPYYYFIDEEGKIGEFTPSDISYFNVEASQQAIDRVDQSMEVLGKMPYSPFEGQISKDDENEYLKLGASIRNLEINGINTCKLLKDEKELSYDLINFLNAHIGTTERIQKEYNGFNDILGKSQSEITQVLRQLLIQLTPAERKNLIIQWQYIYFELPSIAHFKNNESQNPVLFALEQIALNWKDYDKLINDSYAFQHLNFLLEIGVPLEKVYSSDMFKKLTVMGGEVNGYDQDTYEEMVKKFGVDEFLNTMRRLKSNYGIFSGSFIEFYKNTLEMQKLAAQFGLERSIDFVEERIPSFKKLIDDCGCIINKD